MVPIKNFIDDTLRKMKRLENNNCIDLRPYKRDRSVIIEKCGECYNIYEDGFYEEEYLGLSYEEVEKSLKDMRKREFPRSNYVWITVLKSRHIKSKKN